MLTTGTALLLIGVLTGYLLTQLVVIRKTKETIRVIQVAGNALFVQLLEKYGVLEQIKEVDPDTGEEYIVDTLVLPADILKTVNAFMLTLHK